MSKGQSPKIKELVCNVLVQIMDVSTLLPRKANSNDLVIIKLKKKLENRGHVLLWTSASRIVLRLLQFLIANNVLYKDVTIVPSNLPTTLLGSLENKYGELPDVDSAKKI